MSKDLLKSEDSKKSQDSKKTGGLHKGHRIRMKQKYLKDNFDNMNHHEALEMLLYYAIPQRDTNPLAHELLERFGSISGLFDASVASLVDFGLTENVAILIKCIPDFARLYMDDKLASRSKEIREDEFAEFFAPKFIGRTDEALYCLLMDGNMNQIRCELLSKGSFTSTDVPIRRIVETAIMYKAKFVAIAHNHPHGMAVPSKADLDATRAVYKTLIGMNIVLLDHIIIAETESFSVYNSTVGRPLFSD